MLDLVNTILESPQAKLIIDKVQKRLIAEQQKRQAFYATIDEDTVYCLLSLRTAYLF